MRSRRGAPNKLRQIGAKRQRKYEESARSAEEKVRSWREAPKRIWGVGADRRRKGEEPVQSAEESVRSWRKAPKRRWRVSAKRRREGEELAQSAEERVRSWREAPKRGWGVGAKCRREDEELVQNVKESMRSRRGAPKRRWSWRETPKRIWGGFLRNADYENYMLFFTGHHNKKPFVIVFIRESWRKDMFVWPRPFFINITQTTTSLFYICWWAEPNEVCRLLEDKWFVGCARRH